MCENPDKVFREIQRRIARNLARLRAEKRLTFEQLGAAAGLHWRHVQKIEAGEANVTLKTTARLAKGLGVEVFELVRRSNG